MNYYFILSEIQNQIQLQVQTKEAKKKRLKIYKWITLIGAGFIISTISFHKKQVAYEENCSKIESIKDGVIVAITQETLESQSIVNQEFENLKLFIGAQSDDVKIKKIREIYGDLIEKYALISGIDKEIIECLLAQEYGEDSDRINAGGAIGIAQIQYNHHIQEEKKLRNVITGEEETFIVTDDLLKTTEGNIKTGVTVLQNQLDYFNGISF